MISIDCPFCSGPATVDAALTAVDCDACGVTVDVAIDPSPTVLDIAA